VGAEGLRSFEAPLRMRKARRKEKGKKDDKAKARAEDKEREREFTAIANGGTTWGTYTVPRYSAADAEDGHVPEELERAPVPSGAWGARSFAATAHAAAREESPREARGLLLLWRRRWTWMRRGSTWNNGAGPGGESGATSLSCWGEEAAGGDRRTPKSHLA